MSFWARRKFARVQNERTLFGSVKNTVKLDKTWQLHERIRIRLTTLAIDMYNQKKYVIACMLHPGAPK